MVEVHLVLWNFSRVFSRVFANYKRMKFRRRDQVCASSGLLSRSLALLCELRLLRGVLHLRLAILLLG